MADSSGVTQSAPTKEARPGSGPEPRCGLREQKKRQTRHDIHRAALELVLADGMESLTIEKIAERAGVSQRTFFNYFPSKDAAVLGLPPDLGQRIAESFASRPADEQAWDTVVELVRENLNRDPVEHQLRRQVGMAYPELLRGVITAMSEMQASGQDALAERLRAQGVDEVDARRLAIVYFNLSGVLTLTTAQIAHRESISSDEALNVVLGILAVTG
ncbi:MAG: TetR/AcrR family transcriptional regulator [Acidipropionibacterium sp.]|jgi:AcrR family transcriptional regulator|nr:TetR/AcrR family transcriptional regulator [Acidipropionibacterium sp.]